MRIVFGFLLFLFIAQSSTAQKVDFQKIISETSLKENANSIVIESVKGIVVNSQKSATIKTKAVVLVLNEAGLRNVDAVVHYDKSVKVKELNAKMLSVNGNLLKNYRRNDFKDVSVADGFSVFTDNRMLYLDYTPIEYPFVLDFYYETESENTAILPSWYPVNDFYESVVKSEYYIQYPESLGFHYKEHNFQGFNIVKKEHKNRLEYVLENVPALKSEEYSLGFEELIPHVRFALEKFNLEGVEGNVKNWNEFGSWISENLLKGQDELSEATVEKVRKLVENEKDILKKAQIIYEYVQSKTRYVSVQLGIGGWKPVSAKEVDALGYGDCKALSNYTMALLKAVNIPSYYTIIYAGNQPKDIEADLVSMQGNHAILALPYQGKNYFMECTSQTAPFGLEADFTDGRYALIVKPNGGEIVKTNSYIDRTNSRVTTAKYVLDKTGNLNGTLSIVSKGVQYNSIYPIQKLSNDKVLQYYKSEFDVLKKPEIEKYAFQNDESELFFKEELQISSVGFADNVNGQMIFQPNAFNQLSTIPQRYRNRSHAFQVTRGFLDTEEYEITIPDNFVIEALPQNVELNEVFGEYIMKIEKISDSKIIYKRTCLMKSGKYGKEQYESFRKFKERIAKLENAKIVLINK
ncbi:DUF3857 domain-containing protein [Flavobacterium sp.]|uniref:DUF3857 domain-containing protein n=1 Tax=Flavobacterium sp. TaxID=239 RepID=UPI0028BF2C60|nr:DUF3857 domain-containing protein [Flavobacterium sp.]